MKPTRDLPELLDAALADHQLTIQLLDSYRQLNRGDDETAEAVAVANLLRLVNSTLIDHINEEDRSVYPAARHAFPDLQVTNSIDEIQEEHPILVQKAKRLNQILLAEKLRHSPQVQVTVLDFVNFLTQHCVKEDLLFRLIRQTPPGAHAFNLTPPQVANGDGVTA